MGLKCSLSCQSRQHSIHILALYCTALHSCHISSNTKKVLKVVCRQKCVLKITKLDVHLDYGSSDSIEFVMNWLVSSDDSYFISSLICLFLIILE